MSQAPTGTNEGISAPFIRYPIGTSLMMALFPDAVDLSRISDEKWYVRSATDASRELGARGLERILARLRIALR